MEKRNYPQRAERICWFINRKATGRPEDLGRKLNVSEATIYRDINRLKAIGIPIRFCKLRQTYYCDYEINWRYQVAAVCLEGKKAMKTDERSYTIVASQL